jgi:hypothetical protein
MELVHATGMQAGYTMGMRPDGRELLVVCVKGTYEISENGGEPQLAQEQLPLVEADTFTGEPGKSAPVFESDYPPVKPRCDVLLIGSAYAPGGKPARKVPVGLKIGPIAKSFTVVGDRTWEKVLLTATASMPEPFKKMPITYDRAFGGVDANHKNPKKIKAFMLNPIGVGYHVHLKSQFIDGQPLPNTEESGKPIKKPNGSYRPMSFGPVGRGWQPRSVFAGTYDQNWLDNIFPFLPPDFDDRYYQAAPTDQQMPYPRGGETVMLTNLTPEGRTAFRLPSTQLLVWFFKKNGEETEVPAVIDTIMIEPDQRRFMVSWRASLPLKKNMFEVVQVVVGPNPEDKYQGRDPNEPLFPMTAEPDEEESGDVDEIKNQEEVE